MTKRKDDDQPDPPGGRAAERLKQFEEARWGNIPDPSKPEKPKDGTLPAKPKTRKKKSK